MKKIYLFSLMSIYILYAIAVIRVNDLIGDILSPILTFLTFCFVYQAFVRAEKHRAYQWAGRFYALSLLAWVIMDILWGYSEWILQINPTSSSVIINGYTATNVFLLLSLMISGYMEVRKLNKVQVILDMLMISINIGALLWVFIFDSDLQRANLLKTDKVALVNIIINIIILAWIILWYFTTRTRKPMLFERISALGGFVFVLSDLIYYYQYFYTSYDPNSFLDGAYVLSFTIMAISGYAKVTDRSPQVEQDRDLKQFFQFSKELSILIVPVLIFIFQRDQMSYVIHLSVIILLYYLLTNYTQKIVLKEKLLQIERNYITELEATVEERTKEIVRVMNTDVVTGLYNRRYLESYLTNKDGALDSEEGISLLYIDLNKYNSIKSLFGRYIVDALSREVGKRIGNVISKLGDRALLASYGEDVFIVTIKEEADQEQSQAIAKAIISQCSGKYHIDNNDLVVSLNIGIASHPKDTLFFEDLIKNAASAMRYSKKRGDNRCYQFNESIGRYDYNRDNIEIELKKVNFNEDFSLYFQPQVSCDSGELIGAEALIRWYTKSGNYVAPNEFIPIAEESGQIIPLGYWIIEQAARQLVMWRSYTDKELRMAVNVSALQLSERDFITRLKEIMKKYRIAPRNFEMEITENIQLEANMDVMNNLKALRKMGVTIAIDDFGTGYSSLYYFKNLPMDRIKIAKELIDNIDKDSYNHSIIRMVIELAQSRGIKVIAEGVESKEQWECLKKLHCDEIQGYYFAKPMTGENLIQGWLKDKAI